MRPIRRDRTFVERKAREKFFDFIRLQPGLLAFFVAVMGLSCALTWVLSSNPYVRGFYLGATVIATPGAIYLLFLMHGGGSAILGGKWAEGLSRDELERARRRGTVFRVVHNIGVEKMDVDHVVFTPKAIFAVETKWHFTLQQLALTRDVEQAKRSQLKVRSVLRSIDPDREPPEVVPLVVVWGPGRDDLDTDCIVDGVRVLPGPYLRDRLDELDRGRVDEAYANDLADRLEKFKRDRSPRPR